LIQGPSSWVDKDGIKKPLTPADILIIAPANAQVFEIQETASRSARGNG
jgi:uncharacterized protein